MCSLRALGGAVGVEAERTFYCSRNSHVAVVAAVVVAAVVVAAVVAAVVAVVVVVVVAAAAAAAAVVGVIVLLFTKKLAPLAAAAGLGSHVTLRHIIPMKLVALLLLSHRHIIMCQPPACEMNRSWIPFYRGSCPPDSGFGCAAPLGLRPSP